MSKAIHKPSHLAAVENAARVMDDSSGTSVQAGCVVVVPGEPLLAGCVIDGVGQVEAVAQEDALLAACNVDNVAAVESGE